MKYLIVLVLVLPIRLNAQNLIFKLNGKEIFILKEENITQAKIKINDQQLNEVQTKLYNAWRGYSKKYVGFSFFKSLEAVYGKEWTLSQKIVFQATDNYSSIINTKKMLDHIKQNKNIGLIAYKEAGSDGFTMLKKGNKNIDLGPFYLVWTNFNDGNKVTHGDILKWPYQLKEINLILPR